MTLPAVRSYVRAIPLGRGRWSVVGRFDALGAQLVTLQRAGVLFQASAPVPCEDGYVMSVRLIEERPISPPTRAASTAAVWWVGGGIAAATAAVCTVAGLLALRYWAVILGGLAVLLAVWWLLGRAGACPGLHCPGCGCG